MVFNKTLGLAAYKGVMANCYSNPTNCLGWGREDKSNILSIDG